MMDFHSHVLPGMDDGSRSVEESIGMLHQMAVQGVNRGRRHLPFLCVSGVARELPVQAGGSGGLFKGSDGAGRRASRNPSWRRGPLL